MKTEEAGRESEEGRSGLFRKAVVYTFRREVVLAAFSIPASILLNQMLGAEDRGILAIVMLLPNTMFMLGSCQWDRISKGWVTSGAITVSEAWRRTWYYMLVLGVVVIPVSMLGCAYYDLIPSPYRWLGILYSINWVPCFLAGSLAAIVLAGGNMKAYYRMRLVYQGVYAGMILILIVLGLLSVESMIMVFFLVHFSTFFAIWVSGPKFPANIRSQPYPPLSPLGKSFFPYLLETTGVQIPAWAFIFYSNETALGAYIAQMALFMPLGLVSNSLLNAGTARLNWQSGSAIKRYLGWTCLILSALTVPVIILGIVAGKWLVGFVLGLDYAAFSWMIPWIALHILLQSSGNQLHLSLQLSGRMKPYYWVQSFDPFVKLILALALGYAWGVGGILFALVLSSFLKCMFSAWAVVCLSPSLEARRTNGSL